MAEIERSRVRLFGVALLCAKVALVPLVFVYPLDVPFTVPKALLSHGLAYLLAAVLASLLIRFGPSFVVWSWLHVPVLAFLAANALATVFAVDRTLALYGAHVRMLGLGTIADWIVLYFAVVLLVRTRAEAAAIIVSALGASVVVLAYEGVQLLGRDPFSWNTDVTARPFSTIGQPTSLAQYLTTLAVGGLTLAVFADRLDHRVRAIGIFLSAALLAGAAATGTRSAVLGVATGSALLVVLIWAVHPSPRARAISLITGASATVALAALLILSPLGARLATTLESAVASDDEDLVSRLEPSAAGRVALYGIGFEMLRERPLLGDGPDNFAAGVPTYRSASEPREIQQTLATSGHSWVSYVATGSGLIGLAAFLSIIAVALALALRGGFRSITIAAAAMLAAFLGTGLTTVSDIGTDWLFWVSAAAIAGVTGRALLPARVRAPAGVRRSGRAREMTGPESAFRRFAAVPCVAIGLVLAAVGANAFEASRSTREAQDARLLGRIPQAIELGLRATRADPGRAEYWRGLGLAYIGAGRWADASAALERASKLAPYDVRDIGDLARVQLFLASSGDAGARARAVALGERAVQIDPNNPQAQLTKAVVMQATGDVPEALRAVDRAFALDPQPLNDGLYVAAAQIKLASGRPAEAAQVARQGIAVFGATRKTIALRIELARALVASGQPTEALKELDVALSIQPNEPSAERLRAQIRSSLGQ